MTQDLRLEYQVPETLYLAAAYALSRNKRQNAGAFRWGSRGTSIVFWVLFFLAFMAGLQDTAVEPSAVYAFLGFCVGAGLIVAIQIVFTRQMEKRIKRRAREQEDRRGPSILILGASDLNFTNNIEKYEVSWDGVDQIVELPEGSALFCGAGAMPIPDEAVPDGVTPEAFRAQLRQWGSLS